MARGPAQIARALTVYARTAWWGLVAPRLHEERPLVVVQAVILDDDGRDGRDGRILLAVRSDVQGWELPGGNPEPGETLEDALVREVREETGLEVSPVRHVGDYVRSGFRPHTATVHLCRVRGGALTPSDEAPVLRWFPLDRLPDTLFPWYREPISDARRERAEPVRREERQGWRAIWAGIRIDVSMRWRGPEDPEP